MTYFCFSFYIFCLICQVKLNILEKQYFPIAAGTFLFVFWRQYVLLVASTAAIVSILWTCNKIGPSGDWTLTSCLTGGNTYHCIIEGCLMCLFLWKQGSLPTPSGINTDLNFALRCVLTWDSRKLKIQMCMNFCTF